MSRSILVVDDEPDIRALVKDILADEGYDVRAAGGAAEARRMLAEQTPDLLLLDIWMPDEDGISLLKSCQSQYGARLPVIMISGHGTVETAVEATRLGARSFIEKPLTIAKLLQSVQDVFAEAPPDETPAAPREPAGASIAARRMRARAMTVAAAGTPALIYGPPGAGRAELGRYIHSLSARADRPFVVIDDLEAELPAALGFAPGVEVDAGTLFVRRIDRQPPAAQKALAEAMATGQCRRPDGGSAPFEAVVLASADAADGVENTALGALLGQETIETPALAERLGDVPALISACVDYHSQWSGLEYRRFPIEAQNRMLHHDWPGNLRQFDEVVRGLLARADGPITVAQVEEALDACPPTDSAWFQKLLTLPLREARELFEKVYFERLLREVGGNVSRLSEASGMERTHLYRKLRALGVDFRGGGWRR